MLWVLICLSASCCSMVDYQRNQMLKGDTCNIVWCPLVTYHRKIELVEYARTTRLLFIRLLALVKWAGSATNLTKCDVSGSVVCVI